MKVKFNIRRYFQVLGITLGVMLIGALVCLGINYSGGFDGEEVDNTSTVAAYGGKINVLLMGTDVDGLRTDAIMLASYDSETGKVNMLSIPRDTEMYVGNRYQKINAAHAFEKNGVIGGPTATCEAVNRITGIPINYYVDFSFDAVAHVVNELGPIDFTIPDIYGDGVGMVYDDPVQGLHIDLPPGDYKLNGQQAVWVMRYRHGNPDPVTKVFKGYPNGDEDRIAMQQKLLKAIVDQKLNASMILKLPAIFQAVSSEIKTNFTIKDVVKYSKYLTNFSSTNIESYQLPGKYGHDENGDIWIVDLEKTKELVQTVFGYDASNITIDNPEDRSSKPTASPQPKNTSSSGGTSSSGAKSSTSSGGSSTGSSSGNASSGSSTSGSSSGSSSSGSSSVKTSSGSSSSGSSSGKTSSGSASSGSSSSGSSSSAESSSSGKSSGTSSGSGTSSSGGSSAGSSNQSSASSSKIEARDLEDDE